VAEESSESRRMELAAALRRLRADAGLTTTALAGRLGWSQSKVSKIENGITRPSPDDVRALGRLVGASLEDVERLADAAASLLKTRRSWRSVSALGLAARQEEVARYEASATTYRSFTGGSIPGLMQVPAYATATFRLLHGIDHAQIPAAVAARVRRQAVLYEPDKRFTFILGEFALRWLPEGVDEPAWAAQADRLLTLATVPTIDILILPARPAWPYLAGASVIIYDLPDEQMVMAEDGSSDEEYRSPADVEEYVAGFERMRQVCLSGSAALDRIRELTA
jgi:transcriptional regulator with XRE-family HTH domain